MQSKITRAIVSGALALSFAVMSLPLTTPAQAQTKFPAYTSGIQVQNLETAAAQVTLQAFNSDGSVDATIGPDTVAANGSKTYFPLGVTAGFQGSMVISSDRQVAAIANVLSSDFKAGASYVALTEGAPEVQLPLLMKDNAGFTTWFAVQNTADVAANVEIDYSSGLSIASFSLPAKAARLFYQASENHGTSKVFSAVITADQDIVASAIQESSAIMFAYTGFTGGATNPVMPLINANNVGYITGVQIQNAGTQATSVTVTYTPAVAGTACTETQTIQPGASNTFALAAFANNNSSSETCSAGERFVGSAKVTANSTNQPLAAIVNQLGTANGEAYNAFNPADATSKVVMPLIMDRNSNFFTGFNIMNVGSGNTTVTCTFSNTSYTASATLAPDQALSDLQANKIAVGYVGSGTCTASSGGKIVGVVNELGASFDQLLVYEGSNTN